MKITHLQRSPDSRERSLRLRRLLLPSFMVVGVASLLIPLLPGPQPPAQAPTLIARITAPSTAEARIIFVTSTLRFDPVIGLNANARLIAATGPFACEPDEIWRVDVVITQGNARAEGHTQGFCSGEIGMFEVLAVARGRASFAPGDADACARLTTRAGGTVTDSAEWCNVIDLEPAG